MGKLQWWKNAVIYQIYPRSFMDSNNDGDGDLRGIIEKLDYLALLGVDALWLSPIYASPMDDNGYDVSNYFEINPMFGTMDDFDELVVKARERNIKIIMDLVCNHTSTEHPWFKEAISNPNSIYHDFYMFRKQPDDKRSSFGGSAWCYVPELDEYYYHYFDVSQADLNWANPLVRKEVANIVKFWLDKGCGGFRLDAIELIGKELEENIICNGPRIHEYLHDLNVQSFALYPDTMSVGEGWPTVPIALDYTKQERQELNMLFQFETCTLDWNQHNQFGKYDPVKVDPKLLKESISRWQEGLATEGWNTLFLENHDLGRSVSRYANDKEYRVESAKMLATMMYFLKGTPFLYQGQELGATNPYFTDLSLYNDVDTLTKYKEFVLELKVMTHDKFISGILQNSRDNGRTPMHWNSGVNAGFNTGAKPWLSINSNYTEINAEEQINNPNSVFNYYRNLISLRKGLLKDLLIYGTYSRLENLELTSDMFVYQMKHNDDIVTVVLNLGKEEITLEKNTLPNGKVIVHNYTEITNKLRPFEAIVFGGKCNE